ncbi:hypothetical protein D9613_012165 [Agrocybe pediades]|uniref:Uncharacterized protein n=1 Tax=Agrocybe pediades TaxID=84607 RepID=A0A8H4R4Y9_9AGAR|nr:hypothetical protein D9613_012165 [Agrocybe pediades]
MYKFPKTPDLTSSISLTTSAVADVPLPASAQSLATPPNTVWEEEEPDLPCIRIPTVPPSYLEPHVDVDDDEARLIEQFGVEGAAAEELLGFGDDEGSESEEDDDEDSAEEDNPDLLDSPGKFSAFQKKVRVEEAKRAEANRRAGGIKTQNSVEKAWKEFCNQALEKGHIKDTIIDEHHLLLFIKYSAERPKRTPKGSTKTGTRIGAIQEAEDPNLEYSRPIKTIYVWNSLKGRMNEAIKRERTGIGIDDDALDITANTFLEGITDEQLTKVSKAFLTHRELRSTINGHRAWTAQNASGNRGDDFRALRLAELQPYTFTHPDGVTRIECILGCQGEEKAGAS